MRRQRVLPQKRPAAGGEARERASYLFHRKLRPMKQKRSARIAMRRQRILSQKRPPQEEKLEIEILFYMTSEYTLAKNFSYEMRKWKII